MIQHQNIALGVTGSIAAYKAAELVRLLTKAGHQVKVMLSPAAEQFIGALTFQALTGHPVWTTHQARSAQDAMDHIALARWADQALIAPATANCLAKVAAGFADDPICELILATESPVSFAPAMNQQMWKNPLTQRNIRMLEKAGHRILGPDIGIQACGEHGPGRMLEPRQIMDCLFTEPEQFMQGVKLLITAGPTHEPIDPVRYIANHSSGKMGYALAEEAVRAGAQVSLISGPVDLTPPGGLHFITVSSALEMHEAVMALAPKHDVFISAAAVGDYRLEQPLDHKHKRSGDTLSLTLHPNPDILADVANLPGNLRPYCVGFAAETSENLAQLGEQKRLKKAADMIAANQVGSGLAFGQDENALTVVWAGGMERFPQQPKPALAHALLKRIAHQLSGLPCKAVPPLAESVV